MIADKLTGGCDPIPVIELLDKIELIAANSIPCKFVYGVSAVPYTVTITKFSFTTNRRDLDGNPTQVSVDLQLTETPLYDQRIVELEAITFTPDKQVIGSEGHLRKTMRKRSLLVLTLTLIVLISSGSCFGAF